MYTARPLDDRFLKFRELICHLDTCKNAHVYLKMASVTSIGKALDQSVKDGDESMAISYDESIPSNKTNPKPSPDPLAAPVNVDSDIPDDDSLSLGGSDEVIGDKDDQKTERQPSIIAAGSDAAQVAVKAAEAIPTVSSRPTAPDPDGTEIKTASTDSSIQFTASDTGLVVQKTEPRKGVALSSQEGQGTAGNAGMDLDTKTRSESLAASANTGEDDDSDSFILPSNPDTTGKDADPILLDSKNDGDPGGLPNASTTLKDGEHGDSPHGSGAESSLDSTSVTSTIADSSVTAKGAAPEPQVAIEPQPESKAAPASAEIINTEPSSVVSDSMLDSSVADSEAVKPGNARAPAPKPTSVTHPSNPSTSSKGKDPQDASGSYSNDFAEDQNTVSLSTSGMTSNQDSIQAAAPIPPSVPPPVRSPSVRSSASKRSSGSIKSSSSSRRSDGGSGSKAYEVASAASISNSDTGANSKAPRVVATVTQVEAGTGDKEVTPDATTGDGEEDYDDDDDFIKEDDGEDDDSEDATSGVLTPLQDSTLSSAATSVTARPLTTASEAPVASKGRPMSARPTSSTSRVLSTSSSRRSTKEDAPTPVTLAPASKNSLNSGDSPDITPSRDATTPRASSRSRRVDDIWEGGVSSPPSTMPAPGSLSTYYPPSSPVGRQRPASAAPRDRQSSVMNEPDSQDVTMWDVRDVCNWVESIGLRQYRKKFLHHIVDGPLLLMLDDSTLKGELGIGPLGHRVMLLQAISALPQGGSSSSSPNGKGQPGRSPSPMRSGAGSRPSSAVPRRHPGSTRAASQERPRRPASASPQIIPPDPYLGPASGKMTVYEQRAKLLFELDRAAARAAQQKSQADQLLHTANLTDEEVLKLRAMLEDLEYKNRMEVQFSRGSLDSHARIPWRPVGNGSKVEVTNPERLARPGDDPTLDMTFKPRISKESLRIIQEQFGGGATGSKKSTFLDRLENDMRKRDMSKRDLDKKYYSPDVVYQDPLRARKLYLQDLDFVKEFTSNKNLLSKPLSHKEFEMEEQINDLVGTYAEEWKLKDRQITAITSARGEKKVSALASAMRTMLFMQRYETELQQRDEKLRELQNRWWIQTMGNVGAAKEEEDQGQMKRYFVLLGWRGGEEGITDARLNALLARARAYKAEVDGWKEKNRDNLRHLGKPNLTLNWDTHPWTSDGLWQLMEDEMQRVQRSLDGGAPVPGVGKVMKTPHANAGDVTVTSMVVGGPLDYLTYTVKLLAGLRWDSLEKLAATSGPAKSLAVYRGIRTQKFLEFTEQKAQEREESIRQTYNSLIPKKRIISKEQQDGFFERLLDDSSKRRVKVEKLMTDKAAKEQQILSSTKLYTRPRSAR
ncbi:hypothetical protein CEUSTIGMA_g5520.t1 [Chlamydomonas eustigma]|uniref:SAM domain-containing protein n=1 Tax=Chlamydomonas eustigma TaxID=1157962 RepID=A0A250X4S6_9CHLO|nr:hypothetical protein CEUSTIGMA_g5520.t1 [Chlamydomonas eustigma]|eukprot:GAX78078.1 hypothetical protein CEUSTIGMA_g5520.t1 [Chlamydomonas eustigma]